ncbi:hypothetical protein IAD21_01468 [Abditibacteriota bacterium]|nr:hypothetical protein IAD21_01468 [Abditibacteriota bacterium]
MVVKGGQNVIFEPQHLRVWLENESLMLEYDGKVHELAPPRRALPLSSPDEWILLTSSEGEQLGSIRSLSELDAVSRDTLRVALEDAYRITTILQVLDVEREPISGQITWRVLVEASEDEFEGLQSGHDTTFRLAGAEDIQTARYPHIYFADIDGNRWQIPNCEAMDLASRRASERYF